MQSKATTVKDYLASLPADRRKAIKAVREIFLENLDREFEEGMQYGMIGYYVPHSIFPAGYHCDPKQPLPFAGLASQKNHMSLYMMSLYGAAGGDRPDGGADFEKWFREAWAKTGKKLDMGKACIRFKKLEDLALDVIAESLRRVPARKYIAIYEGLRQASNTLRTSGSSKRKSAPRVAKKQNVAKTVAKEQSKRTAKKK